jgi:hypothetical protein
MSKKKADDGTEPAEAVNDMPEQKFIGSTPVESDSSIARGLAPAASERSVDHESSPPPIGPVPVEGDVETADVPAKRKGKTKK